MVGGGPRVRENEDGQIRSGKRAFIKAFAKRFRETETHSRNRFDRHRFNPFSQFSRLGQDTAVLFLAR